jgi:hypothetical protein
MGYRIIWLPHRSLSESNVHAGWVVGLRGSGPRSTCNQAWGSIAATASL